VTVTDLPLFDAIHQARRSDPTTSHAAARQAAPVRHADCAAILDALELATGPLASEQIASRIHRPPVAVSRRMAELRDAGLIQAVDDAYRTSSGRKATRWATTKHGVTHGAAHGSPSPFDSAAASK
jgi:predicted ArsR family transcriptional regulator